MSDSLLNRKYFRFDSSEVPGEFHDQFRPAVNLHNRRYLRMVSFFGIVVGGLLIFRRIFLMNLPEYEPLHIRFIMNLSVMILLSVIYLLFSYLRRRTFSVKSVFYWQRIYMSAVIINFVILTYLDMQIAPDFSAVIATILFLSVTMWLDIFTYAGIMVAINLLMTAAFLTGVHESVPGSELLIEMFIFSFIGMGLFYSIGEGRMRTFTNDLLLRESIEKLRESSLRDPLTGMFNRRMMNEELDKFLALSMRIKNPVSIILLDLDRFKRINDSLGHTAGDEVLKKTATLIESSVRESDSAYRFGGEEFVVILPDTSLQNALVLADRLIDSFRAADFDGLPWKVTASMGLADNTERHLSADLIKLADSRMYRAKETGRDRYIYEGFNEKFEVENIIIPE